MVLVMAYFEGMAKYYAKHLSAYPTRFFNNIVKNFNLAA
jgi:hypothetical protein